MKNLIIIKFGGGLIAPKNWQEETVDGPTLTRLCKEVRTVWRSGKTDLLIVSGSGNFGHAAVQKFGISEKIGASKVQRIAQKIGALVTDALVSEGIFASLVAPHDLWPSGDPKIVNDMLEMGLVPVLYGDVIWDDKKIATIFSGEMCISYFLETLYKNNWSVERILQVGIEDGVWDANSKIIPEISSQNWNEFKKNVSGVAGMDVTGGMLHKVEESLDIYQKYGVKTLILNGGNPGILTRAITGKKVLGTWVK